MRSKLPWITLFLVAFAAGPLPAQILRRHDAAREEQAKKAVEQFEALTKSDTDVFSTMLANVDAVDARDFELLESRNNATLESTVIGLPSLTWKKLLEELEKTADRYRKTAADAIPSATDLDALEKVAGAAAADVKARLKEFDEASKKIKDQESAVEDFQKAIDKLRTAGTVSSIDDLKELEHLPSAADAIQKAIDATRNAPGLQLTLLEVAVDLAKAGRDRAAEDFLFAKRQLELARDAEQRLNEAMRLIQQVGTHFTAQNPGDSVIATIRAAAEDARRDVSREKILRTHLERLSGYISLVGYNLLALKRMSVETSSEELRHSIRMSAINSSAQARLIRSGLAGVSSYYAGGITQQDITNVIDAAQTIVIAILAGRN